MAKSVAVVGAGISGVAAARVLRQGGLDVVVLDRGHRIGGRMAARTLRGTGLPYDGRVVDVGAAFVTADDPGFVEVVDGWLDAGLARPWTDTFHVAGAEGITGTTTGPMRYAAPAGLRSLVEDLAADLPALVHPRGVETVEAAAGGVLVDGERFDAAVLAMPDPQARDILAGDHPVLRTLADDPRPRPPAAGDAVVRPLSDDAARRRLDDGDAVVRPLSDDAAPRPLDDGDAMVRPVSDGAALRPLDDGDAVVRPVSDDAAARPLDDGDSVVRQLAGRRPAARPPEGVPWLPVLSLTAAYESRTWRDDLDAVFVNDHDVLAFVADDGRRRGDGAPVLVAHAHASLAARHLDDPASAAPAMIASLRELLGIHAPAWHEVRRWSLARPQTHREARYALVERVGVCGDAWGARPRVQTAWRSGTDLGRALLASL